MSHKKTSIYAQHNSLIGKIVAKLHNFSAIVFIGTMTIVIFMEVFYRYVLGAGFTWSQELCGLCFLLLVFLCQANTWQEDRHIRMDIFYSHFNPTLKTISNILTIICGLILYGSIIWQSIVELEFQFDTDEATIELMLPLWPFSMIMALSAALAVGLLLRFTFKALGHNSGE